VHPLTGLRETSPFRFRFRYVLHPFAAKYSHWMWHIAPRAGLVSRSRQSEIQTRIRNRKSCWFSIGEER
jgi:hypothetical protein